MRITGIAICLGMTLWLPGADAQSLSALSPFLPRTVAGGRTSPGEPGSLELRGIMSIDQGYEFCVYDLKTKRSVWLAPNEEGPASSSLMLMLRARR